MMELKVAVDIHKEDEYFVAVCESYNLSARSLTIEDALTELQKKLHEYFAEDHVSVSVSVVFVIKMPI